MIRTGNGFELEPLDVAFILTVSLLLLGIPVAIAL